MKILYAASEAVPFCKTGGLADVAGSLPAALAAQGAEVAVVLPLYQKVKEKFGGITPEETVKAMLLPGEIEDLARAVERLCGYRRLTIEEVKNA